MEGRVVSARREAQRSQKGEDPRIALSHAQHKVEVLERKVARLEEQLADVREENAKFEDATQWDRQQARIEELDKLLTVWKGRALEAEHALKEAQAKVDQEVANKVAARSLEKAKQMEAMLQPKIEKFHATLEDMSKKVILPVQWEVLNAVVQSCYKLDLYPLVVPLTVLRIQNPGTKNIRVGEGCNCRAFAGVASERCHKSCKDCGGFGLVIGRSPEPRDWREYEDVTAWYFIARKFAALIHHDLSEHESEAIYEVGRLAGQKADGGYLTIAAGHHDGPGTTVRALGKSVPLDLLRSARDEQILNLFAGTTMKAVDGTPE